MVQLSEIDVERLIDIAIGSPNIGHVNFFALHALLKCFAMKLNISKDNVGLYLDDNGFPHNRDECLFTDKEEINNSLEDKTDRLFAGADEDTPVNTSLDDLPPAEGSNEAQPAPSETVSLLENTKSEGAPTIIESLSDQEYELENFYEDEEGNIKKFYLANSDAHMSLFEPSGSESNESKSCDAPSSNLAQSELPENIHIQGLNLSKFKEVLDNWRFIIQGILTVAAISLAKKPNIADVKRMRYIVDKLEKFREDLGSSEDETDVPRYLIESAHNLTFIHSNLGIEARSNHNLGLSGLSETDRGVLKAIQEDQKILFNKLHDLNAAFIEKDFEREYSKFEEFRYKHKLISSDLSTMDIKLHRTNERVQTLMDAIKAVNSHLSEIESHKVNRTHLQEILDGKPDFVHMKRKINVVDFIQYKFYMEETIGEVYNTLNSFSFRFAVIDEVRSILEALRQADWVRVVKSEIHAEMAEMKEQLINMIEKTNICSTIGVPLITNMPHSLSIKKDKCSSQQKDKFFPSLKDIEKSCAKRLSGNGKPFKLPPKDLKYKGLTSHLVKRCTSHPLPLQKLEGTKPF